MDIGNILGTIKKISETISAKDHVDYLKDQLADLKEQVIQLITENSQLKEEIQKLKTQIPVEDFQDFGNFLLKKSPNGSYFSTPYCPKCKEPLSDFHEVDIYTCTNKIHGNYVIPFRETNNIIEKTLNNL